MKALRLLQRFWSIGFLAIVCCIAFPFAAKAVSCGDTITTDTTLTTDLACEDTAIIIGADDITLNCNGHTISRIGGVGNGIFLNSRTGVTITNCQVTGFENGFWLLSSSNNTLKGNSAIFNLEGFVLIDSADNNTLTGNTATSNIDGFALSGSSNNTLKENIGFGNQSTGFVLTNGSADNTLIENTANSNSPSAGGAGFHLFATVDNTLIKNTANGNDLGFVLEIATNNTLNKNTALNNSQYGFWLKFFSSNNTLNSNTACSNGVFNVLQDNISTGNIFNPNNTFCPPNSF